MTIHYHGTPITPNALLLGPMAGRHLCVSWFRPDQLALALQVAQSIVGDCGAFSFYTALRRELEKRRAGDEPMGDDEFYELLNAARDWSPYYAWCEQIIARPENWVVIPDVIGAGAQEQDRLLDQWPHGERGAPVWHMDEPIDRLIFLTKNWPKVCIGSTGEFWQILSPGWCVRMDDAWTAIRANHLRTPWVHMLRGMQLVRHRWPFASVDSSDVGQNHNRLSVDPATLIDCSHEKPLAVAKKVMEWDRQQTPALFITHTARTAALL